MPILKSTNNYYFTLCIDIQINWYDTNPEVMSRPNHTAACWKTIERNRGLSKFFSLRHWVKLQLKYPLNPGHIERVCDHTIKFNVTNYRFALRIYFMTSSPQRPSRTYLNFQRYVIRIFEIDRRLLNRAVYNMYTARTCGILRVKKKKSGYKILLLLLLLHKNTTTTTTTSPSVL